MGVIDKHNFDRDFDFQLILNENFYNYKWIKLIESFQSIKIKWFKLTFSDPRILYKQGDLYLNLANPADSLHICVDDLNEFDGISEVTDDDIRGSAQTRKLVCSHRKPVTYLYKVPFNRGMGMNVSQFLSLGSRNLSDLLREYCSTDHLDPLPNKYIVTCNKSGLVFKDGDIKVGLVGSYSVKFSMGATLSGFYNTIRPTRDIFDIETDTLDIDTSTLP